MRQCAAVDMRRDESYVVMRDTRVVRGNPRDIFIQNCTR